MNSEEIVEPTNLPKPWIDRVYASLLPPLSDEEFDALKSSIKMHGVQDPIKVDEDDRILDGHHRFKIAKEKAPVVVIPNLTENEKFAFVFQANFTRRNLDPQQKAGLRGNMKRIALDLRKENPRKNTQKRLGILFGVDRSTVSKWFSGSNVKRHFTSRWDARTKVTPKQREEIAARITSGDDREKVADDYDISGRQAANIAKEQREHPADDAGTVEQAEVETSPDQAEGQLEAAKAEYQNMLHAVSKFRKTIMKFARGPHGGYFYIPIIKSAIDSVEENGTRSMPHAICPYCTGSGCLPCKKMGWMPEVTYDNAVQKQLALAS